MWGLMLIGFGVLVLFDRLDVFDAVELWHYWPLALVVFGINKMIGYPTPKHFTSGLWMTFVGLWLFATFEHMWGLEFYNSWPFLIIAWGIQLILEPFIKDRFSANKEQRHEN